MAGLMKNSVMVLKRLLFTTFIYIQYGEQETDVVTNARQVSSWDAKIYFVRKSWENISQERQEKTPPCKRRISLADGQMQRFTCNLKKEHHHHGGNYNEMEWKWNCSHGIFQGKGGSQELRKEKHARSRNRQTQRRGNLQRGAP
jgi:hypothetical protein